MKVFRGRKLYRLGLSALILVLAWLPAAPGQDQKDKKDHKDAKLPDLMARCERNNAIYHVGEKAKFLITCNAPGEAAYRLS
jgi:hypothetical protein